MSNIPNSVGEHLLPSVASDEGAAVLHHPCGVNFQFELYKYEFLGAKIVDTQIELVTPAHLTAWSATIDEVARFAGEGCFSYIIDAEDDGVFDDDDGNSLTILFSPATHLEHNENLGGESAFLFISEERCILTPTDSERGMQLIANSLPHALASRAVNIDKTWENWI